MWSDDISRRAVVAGVGTGIGALAAGSGRAAADPPSRYVVGTETPAATAAARRAAEAVARELDFGDIGRAVAGVYPPEAVERLRERPGVRYVEEDGQYRAIGETVPWGVDRVDADAVHDAGETGGDGDDDESGADIAVIDTGIDDDHPDLDANVGEGAAFVECQGSNCNYAWSDDDGHGTHCAGIADAEDDAEGTVGVSTGATLHGVKVLDSDGAGYWSDIAAGIEWATDQGYDVGSLSLGGSTGSSTVRDACQYAHERGVFLVAAAGNDGPCSDCVSYPAAYDTVVAVSATDESDALAEFSATGPEVELAAPGEGIYSTVIDGYATYSGTSMACPHVAGAAAQLADNGYTNAEIRDRLAETAEDVGLAENEQGAGLLDVEAAVLGTNDPPACSVVDPDAGGTVSGTVTVRVDASDAEDGDDSLTVEVAVDGGSYHTAAYDADSGYYEYDWDTTGEDDGDHTIETRATDSDGATATDDVAVTVDNVENALAVATGEAADVGRESATLSGTLEDLGGAASAEVYVEYGESGTSLDAASDARTLESTGEFGVEVGGLSPGTEYEYRAVADASDGDSDTGATAAFTTASENTAPSASIDAVADRGNPAWDRFAVDWSAGDGDGNLDAVVVSLLDSGGGVLDSARESVGGSTATGSTEVRTKRTAATVEVTATDTAGASDTDSRPV